MLDEASAGFIATLAASGLPPLHELSPREARTHCDGVAGNGYEGFAVTPR